VNGKKDAAPRGYSLRSGSRIVQPGDFLIAQGAGKHREAAEESGKGVAHGGRRIEARMAEANVGKRNCPDGEGARGGIAAPMDARSVRIWVAGGMGIETAVEIGTNGGAIIGHGNHRPNIVWNRRVAGGGVIAVVEPCGMAAGGGNMTADLSLGFHIGESKSEKKTILTAHGPFIPESRDELTPRRILSAGLDPRDHADLCRWSVQVESRAGFGRACEPAIRTYLRRVGTEDSLVGATDRRGAIAQGVAMRSDGHAISPGSFLKGPEAEQTGKRSDVFRTRWFHAGEGLDFKKDLFPANNGRCAVGRELTTEDTE
jgi:hypothetical protein